MKTIKVKGKQGIISRRTSGPFRYHAWPSIVRLSNGTLAVGASAHRVWHVGPFGKTHLYLSRDEGQTWSSPLVVNDTWLDDRDVGLTALPNNGLLLTWFNTNFHILDVRAESLAKTYTPEELALVNAYRAAAIQNPEQKPGSYVRTSEDGGMSWGEATQMEISAPHGPALLNDGSLLYFGKTTERDKNGDLFSVRPVIAMRSTDNGKTWKEIGRPPCPPGVDWDGCYEPHAIQLPSGKIVGVIRYESQTVLTMYVTFSEDGGKTWTLPAWMGTSGAPGHLLRHSSGALLCSYGRRTPGDFSERVLVSWDEGATWPMDICIDDQAPDWDLGYPATVELADGSLMTVYYQKYVDENGNADNKASLLYTVWNLPDQNTCGEADNKTIAANDGHAQNEW